MKEKTIVIQNQVGKQRGSSEGLNKSVLSILYFIFLMSFASVNSAIKKQKDLTREE